MGDKNLTDYVWHAKTNRRFNARCHIETGKNRLRFDFDSDIGPIERPEDGEGNPIFIVSEGGKRLYARGAVTIPAEKGTITFTPQDEGVTEWHWTLTRDGETYTEEGRGMFRPYEPKAAAPSRAGKRAGKKAVRKKKTAARKAVRKKAPARKKKPAARKKQGRRSPRSMG